MSNFKNWLKDLTEKDSDFDKKATPENITHVPADDVVSVYFRQMAVEPLLTAKEEVHLAKRIERGQEVEAYLHKNPDIALQEIEQIEQIMQDAEVARRHLARANTRLVVSIAKRYRNQGMPMADLIQEGNVGLMKAVDKFDYHKGNRFSTYATWWIRQAITRALAKKSRVIRMPLHLSDKLRRVKRTIAVLNQQLGRMPTEDEIAENVGITVEELRDLLDVTPFVVSLEEPVGDNDAELADFLEDKDSPSPEEQVQSTLLIETIEHGLNELADREAKILRLRFGLSGEDPLTLEEIGSIVGLSRERVRQLEKKALNQLRWGGFRQDLMDLSI